MRTSWLIQRLNTPYEGSMSDNPFSFGGGLQNGGLSAEAMNLLRGIFRFDYMGAAEFEFGAVPKALQKLAEAGEESRLHAFTVDIPLSEVEALDWAERKKKRPAAEKKVIVPFWVLSPELEWEDEITRRIRLWAKTDPALKETIGIPRSVRDPDSSWWSVRGWLELDNGFMFFTDHEMFLMTAKLFGVDVKEEANA